MPGPAAPAASSQVTVQLVASSEADALERADEAVDLLLDAGRSPGDILVLTVGEAHPWAQHELSFGEQGYWAQFAEGGDVFYADAFFTATAGSPAAPGATEGHAVRRGAVVLVVNGGPAARAAEAYGKALGHATSLLVVCGDAGPAAAAAGAAGAAAAAPTGRR